ncbi:MAG: serine/threonine protein kinase [bacterium]|nr:serine/threonine protein kinase [bacterium]
MDRRIGHYQIVGELGRGGMGVVYKAHEESLNRFVAIKVLGEHLAEDESYVQRFVREAQSAAKLNHPNIVQIYSISKHENQHFFVMEYVSGTSLLSLMKNEGKVEAQHAATIILQTASGLHAAHNQGVVHRDIKPANLMIDTHGIVKIADFGLALLGDGASRLTATGMFMGTPGYLSPEQCMNEDIDKRTDIYSLGVTFYEALTGVMPFKADSPLALIRQIVEVEPPDVKQLNPELDEDLQAILARMMAKDRNRRFPDCGKLTSALQSYLGASGAGDLPPILIASSGSETASEPPGASTEAAHETSPTRLETTPTVALDSGEGLPPTPPPVPTPQQPPTIEPDPGVDVETEVIPPDRRRGPVFAIAAIAVLAALLGSAAIMWQFGFLGPKKASEESPVADAAIVEAESNALTQTTTPLLDDQTPIPTAAATSSVTEDDRSVPRGSASPENSTTQREDQRSIGTADAQTESIEPPSSTFTRTDRNEPLAQPPTPTPRPRGVAVVSVGEPLLAGEAEALFEQAFARAGILTIDEDGLPEVSHTLTGNTDPSPQVLVSLLQPHARHLLLIRAEYLGDRPLQYMGRSDTAFQSRLVVVAIDLESGTPIGQGFKERLEYTHVNVRRVLGKALQPRARSIIQRLNH